jgi:hypothetical protein
MVHEFLVSRNRFAFPICPRVCSCERVPRGEPHWHRDNTKTATVAVVPRRADVAGIRGFSCPMMAMQTHSVDACEQAGARGAVRHLDQFVTGSACLGHSPEIHEPQARRLADPGMAALR